MNRIQLKFHKSVSEAPVLWMMLLVSCFSIIGCIGMWLNFVNENPSFYPVAAFLYATTFTGMLLTLNYYRKYELLK